MARSGKCRTHLHIPGMVEAVSGPLVQLPSHLSIDHVTLAVKSTEVITSGSGSMRVSDWPTISGSFADHTEFAFGSRAHTIQIETLCAYPTIHPTESHTMRPECVDAPPSKLSPFRDLLPPEGWPKIKTLSTDSATEWYEGKKNHVHVKEFLEGLKLENIDRPWRGFTSDGKVNEGIHVYGEDEGAPVEAMTQAALRIMSTMSEEETSHTVFDSVEADEVRQWSNPEFYVNPGGLRLDECSKEIQDAVHGLLRASLSPAGYEKVLGCCLVNGFLGGLLNGSKVMNEHSYNFRLFGQPCETKPWAFTFFGHHLCIAVFVQGHRMVIGPTFMGAEPDYIDEGPHAGLRLFATEELVSLQLMRSLTQAQRELAVTHPSVLPSDLPRGRWVPHDERHVGGAGQDNRIVPYGEFIFSSPCARIANTDLMQRGMPCVHIFPRTENRYRALIRSFQRILPCRGPQASDGPLQRTPRRDLLCVDRGL